MNSPSEPRSPGSAPAGPRGNGIARLLQSFAHGDPQQQLTMDGLLHGLGRTAFGMFLFVSVLPGFVPIPGFAGVVSGPLVRAVARPFGVTEYRPVAEWYAAV